MREAYRAAMDHIAVTAPMQARILRNIQQTDLRPRKAPLFPFRTLAAAACLALLIIGAMALPELHRPTQSDPPSGALSGTLDIKTAASLQELSQLVGFEVEELTDLPFDVLDIQYLAYGSEMAEIRYTGQDQSLVFRKAAGTSDPSGDYTSYPDTKTLTVDGVSVVLKGSAGQYQLALWQDEAHAYSVNASAPLSDEAWADILGTIV